MLYTLLREDPYLLDHIDRIPFVDTPLHIAASVGHTRFARETMLLKPSFARKLNQDGLTPLHLAMLKAQTKMVDRLLDANSDLVRVKGRERKTPFHDAAEQGNVHLLKIFLSSCPSSIQDVTNTSDIALHIAAKNNGVKLDAKNSDGFTAMDIVERESHVTNNEARGVIKKMLHSFGATMSSPPPTSSTIPTTGNNLVSALNDLGALEDQTQIHNTNIRSEEWSLSYIVS
ncbi:hypothetical protein TIFTF001_003026 [Ficus carica]|uniref:Ankyrin repeat protein n=1 Tax=Ficus carica TaxID=3494 RepID=A0AA87Z7E7_FICCA|nr:hypothetical protein TIFTF001_003026 [Ficus carica]